MYYIAYGSNLNLKDMESRCPNSSKLGSAFLEGYELEFRHYLNINKKEGSRIPVGVFDISPLDIESLDEYEGYPDLYRKEYIDISLDGEEISCLVYIMNEDKYRDNKHPTESYLETCYKGYDDFSFDHEYILSALNRIMCNNM